VSPFTYLVDGMLSVGLANAPVTCSELELLRFKAPADTTCGEYMSPFIAANGGYLTNTLEIVCSYCQIADTNKFLSLVSSNYAHRWRSFGILWLYLFFNVAGAIFLYWLARVPKSRRKV
jgi:ABC-type multidrug transport system permease subunit